MSRFSAALALALVATPLLAAEVVEIDRRSESGSPPTALVAFCTLETAPEAEKGYALVSVARGATWADAELLRTVGMQPSDKGGAFGDVASSVVRHACSSSGSHVLSVAVDEATSANLLALLPRPKDLKKRSPYSASTRAVALLRDVTAAIGLKSGYVRSRAELGPDASIHYVLDILRLNRPPAPPAEPGEK